LSDLVLLKKESCLCCLRAFGDAKQSVVDMDDHKTCFKKAHLIGDKMPG